jgi:hypothetical protein
MALQKITRTTSVADAAAIWDDWLWFERELYQQFPSNSNADVRARCLNWITVWYAVEHGIQLTERAAEAVMGQEIEQLPECPYPPDIELWNLWQALEYAKTIRHDKSTIELSWQLKLAELNPHATCPHSPRPTPSTAEPSRPAPPSSGTSTTTSPNGEVEHTRSRRPAAIPGRERLVRRPPGR